MVIITSFLSSIVAFLAVWAIIWRADHIFVDEQFPTIGRLRLVLFILVMAIIEEGIFRWLILGQGHRIVGLGPAFVVSLVAFTWAHRQNGPLTFFTTINLLLVGLILGTIFWWWGFWAAVAAHFGWNATEWISGFTISGEKTRSLLPSPRQRKIEGYPYGPESHWSATLVMMVCLTILLAPGMSALVR